MRFFASLFIPLFVALAATGAWLLVEYEQNTIFAIDGSEAAPEERAPGALATAAGPGPDAATPAATPPAATPPAATPPAATPPAARPLVDRPARERFARAFDKSDTRPRLAIIVTGLGLARDASFRAIEEMPPEVTLAFSPYAENLAPLLARARDKGHEILLAVPMEPADPKRRDAGPAALSVNHSEGATRQRFQWMLGRVHSEVGIIGDLGDRFARDPVAMKPVFEVLAARGMLYVENRLESPDPAAVGNGVPVASVAIWLDRDLSGDAIDREIAAAEAEAKRAGSAVVLARPYAVTLERLSAWMKTLDKKALVPAPVSAVAKGGS
jgi:polysaccharide deacetylase 2 family uncharacterized protein YibQ